MSRSCKYLHTHIMSRFPQHIILEPHLKQPVQKRTHFPQLGRTSHVQQEHGGRVRFGTPPTGKKLSPRETPPDPNNPWC